jgi:hypothetical protein
MYTSEINKILRRNRRTASSYIGCFPADRIPRSRALVYPHCMVVNTDDSSLPGSHWVAIYVESPIQCDYFDSLAQWPPKSPEIFTYLQQFNQVNRLKEPIQSALSLSCGKHVIYFLHRRCQGWPLLRIVRHLSHCKTDGDRLVSEFVRKFVFDHRH